MNAGVVQERILAEGLSVSNHLTKKDKAYGSSVLCFGNPVSLPYAKVSNQMEDSSKLGGTHGHSRGIELDLNVAHVSPLDCEDHLPHVNNHEMEMSECGSTTGSLEEKEAMSIWKQNSFFSNSYNRLPPPVPKRRERKTKSEMMQKKLEMAKRERVDRFARIAAPSGLFSELNPGIINHVRNSKQVHSIIEALVKSESLEAGNQKIKHASKMKSFSNEKIKEPHCFEYGLLRNAHPKESSIADFPVPLSIKEESFDLCSSHIHDRKDDTLSLKLSSLSTTNCSEGITSLSSADNVANVSLLSLKAATVASQWLDLLHQDAKGRLAALRRSRKRVRSVVETDLPSLLAKDFPSNTTDDTSTLVSKFPINDVAELHQTRWSSLFSNMEMGLSEEEKELEGWISQVKEMQLQCERGLQNVPWNSSFCPKKLRTPGDSWRAESTSNEKGFAVTAAAASIYSTCSFLLNKDQGNT